MKKKATLFGVIIIGFIALVFIDYTYVGIYRNSRVVDITITADSVLADTIYHDTLYAFKKLQPGQVKFSFKDRRLELFDIKSDSAFYSLLMYNLDDRASRITIDEFEDGKRVASEVVGL